MTWQDVRNLKESILHSNFSNEIKNICSTGINVSYVLSEPVAERGYISRINRLTDTDSKNRLSSLYDESYDITTQQPNTRAPTPCCNTHTELCFFYPMSHSTTDCHHPPFKLSYSTSECDIVVRTTPASYLH